MPAGAAMCPKCGCPVLTEEEKRLKVLEARKKRSKKIAVFGVAVVACAIVGAVVFTNVKSANNYNSYVENLERAGELMLEGAADAEDLTNLTGRVWRDAIYEESDSTTRKYVRPSGDYVDDFNTALVLLYSDDSTISITDGIEENQEEVRSIMKELQNPPEGLEECYRTVTELYDSYGVLTELAINPTGSLTTFNSSVNEAVSDFSSNYKKLDSQIPDK